MERKNVRGRDFFKEDIVEKDFANVARIWEPNIAGVR